MGSLIAAGNWGDVRKYCRPRQRKQERLQHLRGGLGESHERAYAMVDFLEQVQWRVRPAHLVGNDPVGTDLP
eukprot:7434269-Pyramimonas_sp.AAC.1